MIILMTTEGIMPQAEELILLFIKLKIKQNHPEFIKLDNSNNKNENVSKMRLPFGKTDSK